MDDNCLIEKFNRLSEENKAIILSYLDQLTESQSSFQLARGSPVKVP